MINTVDGVTKKYGQFVYVIGMHTGKYTPVRFQYRESDNWQPNQSFWADKKLCEEQCELMNRDKK